MAEVPLAVRHEMPGDYGMNYRYQIQLRDEATGLWHDSPVTIQHYTEEEVQHRFLWWTWKWPEKKWLPDSSLRRQIREKAQAIWHSGQPGDRVAVRIAEYKCFETLEDGDWERFNQVIWLNGVWN